MTYEQFHALVITTRRPVILIEGTRRLPETDVSRLISFARYLAKEYHHAIFRTGNAKGSDEAFAEGVCSVDPTRLEYVLPYVGHRKGSVHDRSYQVPLPSLSKAAEERAVYLTSQSSPQYTSLLERREMVPQLRSKSRYLLRDTLKVMGDGDAGLAPATVGIFYANRDDPMAGGTGHTIRVCRHQSVPTVLQHEWLEWPACASQTL